MTFSVKKKVFFFFFHFYSRWPYKSFKRCISVSQKFPFFKDTKVSVPWWPSAASHTWMDAFRSHQLLGHGRGYRGDIRSPQVPDPQVSKQRGGRGFGHVGMEVRQRQVPLELVSANHVSDHRVLTDGHLGRQLSHNLAIWEGASMDRMQWLSVVAAHTVQ